MRPLDSNRPPLALALAAATALPTAAALASSHREAPFITKNPKVDATDFYMFNSYEPGREGYVTLIANYLPLQDAYGGPTTSPWIPRRSTRSTSTTTATPART